MDSNWSQDCVPRMLGDTVPTEWIKCEGFILNMKYCIQSMF